MHHNTHTSQKSTLHHFILSKKAVSNSNATYLLSKVVTWGSLMEMQRASVSPSSIVSCNQQNENIYWLQGRHENQSSSQSIKSIANFQPSKIKKLINQWEGNFEPSKGNFFKVSSQSKESKFPANQNQTVKAI